MLRPIAIGLSPNLEFDDILLAIKNVLTLKVFVKNTNDIEKLNIWFKKKYNFIKTFPLDSGRSGLYLALKSLDLKAGDEVIVPAFTCVAVPNSVLWLGLKPIYVDIDRNSLNFNLTDLKKKITIKTKAIIYQYTLGIPGDIEEVIKIAKKNNICVIEDCAHIIDGNLGTKADMSVFSFGRDKAVSSVFGGLIGINNSKFITKFESIYNNLKAPSLLWVLKQYFHIVLMLFVLPLYNFLSIGKVILALFQKIHFIDKPVFSNELIAEKPIFFPRKLDQSLASLVLNQLLKIEKFNQQRKKYTNRYIEVFGINTNLKDLPLLRFPMLIKDRNRLISEFKNRNIIIGNWYHNIIDPEKVDFIKIDFKPPKNAHFVAQHIINLPTYPTFSENDFQKVIGIIKKLNIEIL